MRIVLVAPVLAAGLLLTGCSSGESSGAAAQSGSPAPSRAPSSGASGDVSDRDAVCRKVRAGVDAFNTGDLQSTVTDFKQAVPLAVRAQQSDPSPDSRLLLRAVRYYAALAPDAYPEAARSSLDFQRWKAVTLGLCVSGQDQLSPGPDPEESGIPA